MHMKKIKKVNKILKQVTLSSLIQVVNIFFALVASDDGVFVKFKIASNVFWASILFCLVLKMLSSLMPMISRFG